MSITQNSNKFENGVGSSGHKGSLRGTKLAQRARSFKDEFLEKISQIRTPPSTMSRTNSPSSPRSKSSKVVYLEETTKPVQDLNYHVRQVKHSLTHFKDVVSKNKLEMLHGNGSIILESIGNVLTALQTYSVSEPSSLLISANTQLYVALEKLIKMCDEISLIGIEEHCVAISNDNVKKTVDEVEEALDNLVKLSLEKFAERQQNSSNNRTANTLQRPTIDVAGQRTSLPDIPLTPRERDILQKTSSRTVRASHSTESILRDTSPPPKPPLPHRFTDPPPLPPKKKNHTKTSSCGGGSGISGTGGIDSDTASDLTFPTFSQERNSWRSKSPEDNTSLLSASACSLDSALNQSRDDENNEQLLQDDNQQHHYDGTIVKSSSPSDAITKCDEHVPTLSVTGVEGYNVRHSNESGFISIRSSTQSVLATTKGMIAYNENNSQIHQNQHQQQQKIILNNNKTIITQHHHHLQQQQQQQMQQQIFVDNSNFNFNYSSTTSSSSSSSAVLGAAAILSSTTSSSATATNSNFINFKENKTNISFEDNFEKILNTTVSNESFERSLSKYDSVDSTTMITGSDDVFQDNDEGQEKRPELPIKTRRSLKSERRSHYDNIHGIDSEQKQSSIDISCGTTQMSHHTTAMILKKTHKTQSLIEPPVYGQNDEPPPLPIKKKHIMAYMEIFGNCSQSSTTHIGVGHHNSYDIPGRAVSMMPSISHSSIKSSYSLSSSSSEKPPELPPKRRTYSKTSGSGLTPPTSPKIVTTSVSEPAHGRTVISTPPSPSKKNSSQETQSAAIAIEGTHINLLNEQQQQQQQAIEIASGGGIQTTPTHHHSHHHHHHSHHHQHHHNKDKSLSTSPSQRINLNNRPSIVEDTTVQDNNEDVVVLRRDHQTLSLIEEINVLDYLIYKKEGEDGPDIKGGHLDALIIHATKVEKISNNAYSEAFITTFRTFMSPLQLIEKLTYRYSVFYCQVNDQKQKAAKEAFSLLVRVVNDLTFPDLSYHCLKILIDFVHLLIGSGHLSLARFLREEIREKIILFKQKDMPFLYPLSSRSVTTNLPNLIELKSVDIAEQMTLLDSELFEKIEIPEVLIWAKEQCEERSPNLTRFTEHFNKMSYWARSQILKQEDAKDRERYVNKFIKIMRHLRKINNYNSYLALLSALDSAPIRRLEWQKTITEPLKEYCTLIDSSSSFRAYRMALAETNPPCIPYIGLVLQDLTFVHVGNPDYLNETEEIINFSKRWQQYNIVVNMKRFKKSSYSFKKNDRIIRFFDNFENYLDEDTMWQISENIKPRICRKPLQPQTH